MTQDFATRFQTCFHQTYTDCYRRLPSEADRLTPQTVAILSHLAKMGPATVQELATHFNRAQSTVTQIIDRLQQGELVARMPDERDRRRVFIWLTDHGKQRMREATTPLDPDLIADMSGRLSETEQVTLLTLFEKLTQEATQGEKP